MKEEFLHLIWNQQLFNSKNLESTSGEDLEILNRGLLNANDGPDFLEGKIEVDSTILVGNIEIHVYASDWIKHKHSSDKRYDNVILHVVWIEDVEIRELNCPTLELSGRVSRYYIDNYNTLLKKTAELPCRFLVNSLDENWLGFYKEKILIERFTSKTNTIIKDFDQIKLIKIYEVFLSYIGGPKNSYGFVKLSTLLPIKLINKYKSDQLKIEALLFGVSGFLPILDSNENYIEHLNVTFNDLQQLHGLKQMQKEDWLFLRIRPNGFPTIKLALLSALFAKIDSLENLILKYSFAQIKTLILGLEPNDFWDTHYTFNKRSKFKKKGFGESTFIKLLINCIFPLRLVYSTKFNEDLSSYLEYLRSLPSESNSVVDFMVDNGFINHSAYDSQFNLHKNKHYCIPRKCINCGIGQKIIKKT